MEVFLRWGKCGAMRVDNGEPLGSPKKNTTSALALWLIANDVDMIFNKPYCPQSNAKVERMQDVSARWAEILQAQNLIDLQNRLDKESIFQRTEFCVSRLENKTRLQTFPELETSRRVFRSECFDPQRVYDFLAQKIYIRLVSKTGQIALFGERFSVGLQFKSQYVEIKLDPTKCLWSIFIGNKAIKTHIATNLSKERLQNLTVYVKERRDET